MTNAFLLFLFVASAFLLFPYLMSFFFLRTLLFAIVSSLRACPNRRPLFICKIHGVREMFCGSGYNGQCNVFSQTILPKRMLESLVSKSLVFFFPDIRSALHTYRSMRLSLMGGFCIPLHDCSFEYSKDQYLACPPSFHHQCHGEI